MTHWTYEFGNFWTWNFSLNMSNFPLSPPSSFPLLWCTTSSWSGKCLASTNSLVMTSTSTHCALDSLPQNPNKLIDSKPICGTMQREDPGHLMTDAKYAVGSKYWRVWCDLWVTTKEGNVKEVPGGGWVGYLEVMTWGCGGSCPWAMGWVAALGLVASIICYACMFSAPLEPSHCSLCLQGSLWSKILAMTTCHPNCIAARFLGEAPVFWGVEKL